MSRQEMIALKLQMGIDPTAKITPNVLLAMWQQLMLEKERKQCNQSSATLSPGEMPFTPIVV